MRILDYEEWLAVCKDDIDIELAENGADREMDFDPEEEYYRRYTEYGWWCEDYFDGILDKSKGSLLLLYNKMFENLQENK
tara:strand:- start:2265 stop:2504 length:240 start_codon:yes stop_codon:yes gene_type:complete